MLIPACPYCESSGAVEVKAVDDYEWGSVVTYKCYACGEEWTEKVMAEEEL